MGIRDDERRKTTQAHAGQPPLRGTQVGHPNHAIRETLRAPPHLTQVIRRQQGGPLHHHLILLDEALPVPGPSNPYGNKGEITPLRMVTGTTSLTTEQLDKARVAPHPEHGRHAKRSRERESLRPR